MYARMILEVLIVVIAWYIIGVWKIKRKQRLLDK